MLSNITSFSCLHLAFHCCSRTKSKKCWRLNQLFVLFCSVSSILMSLHLYLSFFYLYFPLFSLFLSFSLFLTLFVSFDTVHQQTLVHIIFFSYLLILSLLRPSRSRLVKQSAVKWVTAPPICIINGRSIWPLARSILAQQQQVCKETDCGGNKAVYQA